MWHVLSFLNSETTVDITQTDWQLGVEQQAHEHINTDGRVGSSWDRNAVWYAEAWWRGTHTHAHTHTHTRTHRAKPTEAARNRTITTHSSLWKRAAAAWRSRHFALLLFSFTIFYYYTSDLHVSDSLCDAMLHLHYTQQNLSRRYTVNTETKTLSTRSYGCDTKLQCDDVFLTSCRRLPLSSSLTVMFYQLTDRRVCACLLWMIQL